ncbi:MAG: hypothetical protein WA672_07720 [Candidatus Angelobacter sp.]
MNWSFVFLAQYEDPEDTSIAEQLSIGKIKTENEFRKIRNAETGKPREKNASSTTFQVTEKT